MYINYYSLSLSLQLGILLCAHTHSVSCTVVLRMQFQQFQHFPRSARWVGAVHTRDF